MSITNQDIKHIAQLARIELTEEEESLFEKNLSSILDFVGTLNAVNTDIITPVTGGTTKQQSVRKDEQISDDLEGESATLTQQAPEIERGFIKVKTVFE